MLKLRIALRYLLSRKQFGAVNVISVISVAAVAVAAAAMVIVLSVFNGFEQLARTKLSAIDPDYILLPSSGKQISDVDRIVGRIGVVNGVEAAYPQISERAYACSNQAQMAVTLMGIHPLALHHSGLSRIIIDGSGNSLSDSTALVSVGVAMGLGVRPYTGLDSIAVYEPKRVGAVNPANPMAGFRKENLRVAGVYQVEQEEYDRDMIVVPYDVAAGLLAYRDMASSLAVYTSDSGGCEPQLREIADEASLVLKNRYEQQEQTFRMIEIEKWISFLMLGFILIIASANIISTLSMLVLEKEPNMAILNAMGATRGFIRGVFTTQGWLIVILGGVAGILLGVMLVLGQMHFGWVRLGASNPELMSIDIYPVVLRLTDVLYTIISITGVALLLTPVVGLVVKHR